MAEFLGIDDIRTGFHLPLSVQAHQEVRHMQLITAATSPDHTDESPSNHYADAFMESPDEFTR